VNADLVGSTRVQAEFKQACTWPGAHDFPICFRWAAATPDGHALAGNGVTADGAFPSTCISAGPTQNVCEIGFFCFTISKLAAEFAVSGIIFCGDEKACGFTIQTMNDSRPIGGSAMGEFPRAVVQESCCQRARGPTCPWMNMHSRGFVDDQDIFVLVQDFEWEILGRDFTR
jgi:hypothetical protein